MNNEANNGSNKMTKRIEGDFYGVNMNPSAFSVYYEENVSVNVHTAWVMTVIVTAAFWIVNTLADLQHAGIL